MKKNTAYKTSTTFHDHTITISLRPNSKTNPTYTLDYYRPDGIRRRPSTRTTDLEQAKRFLKTYIKVSLPDDIKDALNKLEQKTPTPNPTIYNLVTWYLDIHCKTLNLQPRTLEQYTNHLTDFVLYCRKKHIGRIQQISWNTIEQWNDDNPDHAPKTKHNRLSNLRAFFNAAYDTEKIADTPIRKWFLPRLDEPEIHSPTITELQKVLSCIKTHSPKTYNITAYIAATGSSPTDAINLHLHQIILPKALIVRPRAKIRRLKHFHLNTTALKAIKNELQRSDRPKIGPNDYIFTDDLNHPFTYNILYRTHTRTLRKHNAPHVTFKDMRHFYGKQMTLLGCPLKLLMQQMNHTRVDTAMKYQHYAPEEANRWNQDYAELLKNKTP